MNDNTETKVVRYLGQIYEVPLWANFIAADLDGDIYIYEQEPHWTTQWYSKEGNSSVFMMHLKEHLHLAKQSNNP